MKSLCCRVNSVEARQSKHAWALFAISGMHVRCRVRQKCRGFPYTNARLRWLSWKRMGGEGGGGWPFYPRQDSSYEQGQNQGLLNFLYRMVKFFNSSSIKTQNNNFIFIDNGRSKLWQHVRLFVCLFALCYFFFFCKPPDNRHPRFNSAMIIITCRRFHDYQVDEI